MTRSTTRIRLIAVIAALMALAACVPFESLMSKLPRPGGKDKPDAATAAAVAAQMALPLAEATHRFVVADGQDVVGRLQVTLAHDEDTFADIARRFNVGYAEIVRANPGVDPWLPGEGTAIVLPTEFVLPDAPREGLVLNLAAMRLYYYPKREKDAPLEVFTYPIGIGKVGWVTPEGSTKVVSRIKDPVWTPPLSVRQEHAKDGDILPEKVPPGPDNPLGRHMMRLGWPSYLVHGTNKPPGVGMRSSHGCIRLYPEDIEHLFEAVPDGTKVTAVNQPYLVGWRGDRLYIQAYEPLADDERDWSDVPKALRQKSKKSRAGLWKHVAAQAEAIDWERVRAEAAAHRGIAVAVGPGEAPAFEDAIATAPKVRNTLPNGSNWDGVEDQYAGDPQFARPAEGTGDARASASP